MLVRRTDTSSFPFLNSEVQCTVYLSGCKEIQRSCRLQNKVLHNEQHYPRPPKTLLRVSWSLVCPIWNIEFVFVYTGLKIGEQQETNTISYTWSVCMIVYCLS